MCFWRHKTCALISIKFLKMLIKKTEFFMSINNFKHRNFYCFNCLYIFIFLLILIKIIGNRTRSNGFIKKIKELIYQNGYYFNILFVKPHLTFNGIFLDKVDLLLTLKTFYENPKLFFNNIIHFSSNIILGKL